MKISDLWLDLDSDLDMWEIDNNKKKSTEEILDGVPLVDIEKYLRKKKLEKINKKTTK